MITLVKKLPGPAVTTILFRWEENWLGKRRRGRLPRRRLDGSRLAVGPPLPQLFRWEAMKFVFRDRQRTPLSALAVC